MDTKPGFRKVPVQAAASSKAAAVRASAAAIAGFATTAVVAACAPGQGGAETTSAAPNPSTSQSISAGQYADGQYEALGSYGSGPSSISVNVTLDNGTVTAVRVIPNATNETSLDYQKRFAEAVPAVVVGRRMDDLNVGKIAGSSSTPDGFNNALTEIKEAAQQR
jgi:uncharacterized protein with FMN-binding domain